MLCASGAAARAQDADTRHGGWMGLGLGYGLARLTCASCRGARQLGGWCVELGLGGSGGAVGEAGVGFSNYALEHGTGDAIEPVSDDYPSYSSGTGWGYTLGVGWHGMRVAYHYGTVGALRDAGGATVATGWKQQLVLVEFLGRVGPEPPTARVHAHARILNRAFPRPGMCPAAVTLFAAPSEVGKPYVEVAQISPSRSGSREPTPEQVDEAERNKAAELGANGVILKHIAGSREVLYYDALAIYVPADSARASAECGS